MAFSEDKQTQVAAKTRMSIFDFQFVKLRAPHQKKTQTCYMTNADLDFRKKEWLWEVHVTPTIFFF